MLPMKFTEPENEIVYFFVCWTFVATPFLIFIYFCMEGQLRLYSNEEDLQIASCMLNYFSELGLGSADDTTCSERQKKYEVTISSWNLCGRDRLSKFIQILTQIRRRRANEVTIHFALGTMFSLPSFEYSLQSTPY